MMKKDLYRIGSFAKVSNVTAKQLRYLEEKGLLIPKMRKENNNYRYYSHDQMEQLIYIETLRDLGMPFEKVVKILQTEREEECVDIMEEYLGDIDRQIQTLLKQYQSVVLYITQMVKGKGLGNWIKGGTDNRCTKIEIIDFPEQKVLFTRYKMNVLAEDLFIERFFELKKEGAVRNLKLGNCMHAIFHDGYQKQFEDTKGDLETFYPVLTDAGMCENIRRINQFKGVSCTYLGHYENMEECYRQMKEWAEERNIETMDASMEKYIIGPDLSRNPEEYVTQIIIPLKNSIL